MYYPCSENKGADQLRGYREADLRLCFRLCKLLVFSCTGSFNFFSIGWRNRRLSFEVVSKVCNFSIQLKLLPPGAPPPPPPTLVRYCQFGVSPVNHSDSDICRGVPIIYSVVMSTVLLEMIDDILCHENEC